MQLTCQKLQLPLDLFLPVQLQGCLRARILSLWVPLLQLKNAARAKKRAAAAATQVTPTVETQTVAAAPIIEPVVETAIETEPVVETATQSTVTKKVARKKGTSVYDAPKTTPIRKTKKKNTTK